MPEENTTVFRKATRRCTSHNCHFLGEAVPESSRFPASTPEVPTCSRKSKEKSHGSHALVSPSSTSFAHRTDWCMSDQRLSPVPQASISSMTRWSRTRRICTHGRCESAQARGRRTPAAWCGCTTATTPRSRTPYPACTAPSSSPVRCATRNPRGTVGQAWPEAMGARAVGACPDPWRSWKGDCFEGCFPEKLKVEQQMECGMSHSSCMTAPHAPSRGVRFHSQQVLLGSNAACVLISHQARAWAREE